MSRRLTRRWCLPSFGGFLLIRLPLRVGGQRGHVPWLRQLQSVPAIRCGPRLCGLFLVHRLSPLHRAVPRQPLRLHTVHHRSVRVPRQLRPGLQGRRRMLPWMPSRPTVQAAAQGPSPSSPQGPGPQPGRSRNHARGGIQGALPDSPLAVALADNVHGTREPTGPPLRPDTVTLSHSPSALTAADTELPATCLTMPSTAPVSSPLASPLAPALAASSNLSWVRPAAEPASTIASSNNTAGKATANSAVTAPRHFPAPGTASISIAGVMVKPAPYG